MRTDLPASDVPEGPPYVQAVGSRYCSSAWGENCCDRPNGHDGYHYDDLVTGKKWTADVVRCTCGSGAHPRECTLHPENFAKHVAELQADNDADLTNSERKEWRS